MKKIPLTQGKFVIVDDEDYEWLNQWKWYVMKHHNNFYAARVTRRPKAKGVIQMHRQILGLKKDDGKQTDHKDGNGLDNRQSNIRICSNSENHQNLHRLKKNKSCEYQGVCRRKTNKKWMAYIKKNQKWIYLGQYDNKEDAARAYDKKALELFGPDAKTNLCQTGKE